jgi:hypothetical protein
MSEIASRAPRIAESLQTHRTVVLAASEAEAMLARVADGMPTAAKARRPS